MNIPLSVDDVVREADPRQQGLKPGARPGRRHPRRRQRGRSTTTRIETRGPGGSRIGECCQRGRSTTTRIETVDKAHRDYIKAEVREADPRQQGLKLRDPDAQAIGQDLPGRGQRGRSTTTRIETPGRSCTRSGPSASQRGRSTTTRIETRRSGDPARPLARVREADPRQQGLKLPSARRRGRLRRGQRGRSTTTRIETPPWPPPPRRRRGVREADPRQQGLKHRGGEEVRDAGQVSERQIHDNKD